MLRFLTAAATLLSVFASIRLVTKTSSLITQDRFARWSTSLRAHNQFGNWT
jgi:hypothetical protein